jgi:integrase
MARKRKLDPYTSIFVDRHGKERCRFRRRGMSCYLPHPSAKGYRDAYKAALAGLGVELDRSVPKSVDELVARFYRSAGFLKGGEGWQATVRAVLEPFREEFRKDQVADFRFDHIEVVLARKAKKADGKGGPAAAARLHEQLKRLFAFAVRLEWIGSSPAEKAELPVKVEVTGFHSWTEAEIGQYQARHPLGTKARLALEIPLWTGLRRGDTVRLGPQHLRDGRITMNAGKTNKVVDLLAAPALVEAIDAMPAIGLTTFLVTDYGKPFTVAGFGGWFRERCNEAGLPHCTAHGLRKALTRRAAELGATQQQLKAVGQWSGDREVGVYTAAANQRGLADAAIAKVVAWTGSNGQHCLTGETG